MRRDLRALRPPFIGTYGKLYRATSGILGTLRPLRRAFCTLLHTDRGASRAGRQAILRAKSRGARTGRGPQRALREKRGTDRLAYRTNRRGLGAYCERFRPANGCGCGRAMRGLRRATSGQLGARGQRFWATGRGPRENSGKDLIGNGPDANEQVVRQIFPVNTHIARIVMALNGVFTNRIPFPCRGVVDFRDRITLRLTIRNRLDIKLDTMARARLEVDNMGINLIDAGVGLKIDPDDSRQCGARQQKSPKD